MNFQISVHWTALTSLQFISKYGAASLAEKMQDDLRQNLIDAWVGVEQSIIDTALISGADVSMSALEPQEDIFNNNRDIN